MFRIKNVLLFALLLPAPICQLKAQEAAKTAPGDKTHDFLGLGPAPDPAAAKLGEPLYQQNCSACHGSNARGGVGPNLLRSVLILHDEKGKDVAQIVRNGRGAMPAFANLSSTQIYDIAEYIHLQVELAANRGLYKPNATLTTGTASAGKAFFQTNCAQCHSQTGDLSHVGSKFTQPADLMLRIAWPSKGGPRTATVTASTGKQWTGTLIHYDDFETTLHTLEGTTLTWPTESIKVDIPDPLVGHRELLPRYTDDDLHNLTQYLMSLK